MLILAMPLLFICYLASACFFNLFSNQTLREKFITTKFAKAPKPYFVQELEFIKQHIAFDKSRVRDDILLITNNDQDFYFDLELRLKSPLNIINIRHMFNLDEVAEIQNLITSQKIKSVIFITSKNKEVISVMSDQEIEELEKLLKKYYFISAKMHSGADERLEIYEKIKS
jgi:Trm5-related predicted tRNA methylase